MNDKACFLSQYDPLCGDTSIPASVLEWYEVISCLKHSPKRQVFLMGDRASGDRLVLKLAPADQMDVFRREYALLRRLHSRAFPHPIACFESDGYACLLREYAPGRSLAEHVEDNGPFTEAQTAEIGQMVCEIVRQLHRGTPPVVHRDIKPQNLILAPDGTVRLVDLDAAETLSDDKAEDTLVMGTAVTAAPEQFGYRRCDERTDVYAIGVLMVYLLTGGYGRESLKGQKLSPFLKRVIHRCISFDPDRRPASAQKLITLLGAWQQRRASRIRVLACVAVALVSSLVLLESRENLTQYVQSASSTALGTPYEFASPLIERAVRLQLRKPQGIITLRGLNKVSALYLCAETPYKEWEDLTSSGQGIQVLNGEPHHEYARIGDLSDLKNMPNLRRLALNRLDIQDLTALEGLNLTYLGLGSNQLTDLSPIFKMTRLEALDISDNPISDLSGLESLPVLSYLNISAVPAKSLAPLAGTRISVLDMFDVDEATDCLALADMDKLTRFGSRNLPQAGVNALSGATSIKHALLLSSGADSPAPFSNMKNLLELTLRGSPLKNLQGISSLVFLRMLDVSECTLTDMEELRDNKSIQKLNIANNPLIDLSALRSMMNLKELVCSRNQRSLVSLLGNVQFSISYID